MELPYAFPSDDDLRHSRVLVMGLGLFGGGEGVVRFLASKGAEIVVTDLRSREQLSEPLSRLAPLRFETVLGEHRDRDFRDADWVVVSPAVDPSSRSIQRALDAGAKLTSEVGLTLSRLRGKLAMVTGSKGKSTTTALIHAMAQGAGRAAWIGGNVGRSLLPHLDEIGDDAVVAFEISSFQLEQIGAAPVEFGPRAADVAVITNLFPIHLDRHGDFDAYREVKRRVLIGASAAVLPWEDRAVRELAESYPGEVRWHGTSTDVPLALRLRGANIETDPGDLVCDGATLSLLGDHNRRNVMAALLAADLLGLHRATATVAASRFPGLPHRLETVGVIDGVRYVNDSIATSPRAVIAALSALDGRLFVLLGGKENGADVDDLVTKVSERVIGVALFGEVSGRLARAFAAKSTSSPAVRMREVAEVGAAVTFARECVVPGDTVLLSPGFPSLDQHPNFMHRGDRFREVAIDPTVASRS